MKLKKSPVLTVVKPSAPRLKLDWASFPAAKYACTNWHYAGVPPCGKLVKIGVWEADQENVDRFIGTIIYSRGANKSIASPYNLTQFEVCELTRVALRDHVNPVSKMLAISLKMLRKKCPGVKLVISYADAAQNHHGGIYQATNWIYEGKSDSYRIKLFGKLYHPRSLYMKWGPYSQSIPWLKKNIDPQCEKIEEGLEKHKYLMPLDDAVKAEVMKLAKPYPKRVKQAMAEYPSEQRQGSTDRHAP